jgi:hypothetical protein
MPILCSSSEERSVTLRAFLIEELKKREEDPEKRAAGQKVSGRTGCVP